MGQIWTNAHPNLDYEIRDVSWSSIKSSILTLVWLMAIAYGR